MEFPLPADLKSFVQDVANLLMVHFHPASHVYTFHSIEAKQTAARYGCGSAEFPVYVYQLRIFFKRLKSEYALLHCAERFVGYIIICRDQAYRLRLSYPGEIN